MERLLDLIGDIYEASFNPDHWNTTIRALCEHMQARSGGLFIEDHATRSRGMIGAHGLPATVRLSYRLGMAKHDHTFQLQQAQPLGEAKQLVEAQRVHREHPLFYRLILRPNDIGHIAAMNIYNDDEWHVGIGLHRSFKADAFPRRRYGTWTCSILISDGRCAYTRNSIVFTIVSKASTRRYRGF